MPSVANLALYQGDDYAATVAVSDGSGPAILTGYVAQAQIRQGAADDFPDVLVEIDTDLVLPSTINLNISRDVTVMLAGRYAWDLQVTGVDGVVTTILAGDVIVTKEVTRE